MKKILGHTWKAVSYNLGNLLLFEIGYRILTFFLAMQMIDQKTTESLSKAPGRSFFLQGFWHCFFYFSLQKQRLCFGDSGIRLRKENSMQVISWSRG